MAPNRGTAICTWFVADADSDATFFPQIGTRSNTPEAKAIYWRCVACFYVSSVILNPGRAHLFFTNTALPEVDGVSFATLFERLGVKVVTLPITYRLRTGTVTSWGNQFYILDILEWFARSAHYDRAIVLDSDCVWVKPIDAIEAAIDRYGALTYELGHSEHAESEEINGLSRAGMARFLAALGGPRCEAIPYHGGEIVAATHNEIVRIVADIPEAWRQTEAGGADAPREEAHLLSVLYARHALASGTANHFIRRIWTNLTLYDASRADGDLTIWHLPSAKRFGFAALFRRIARAGNDWCDPCALGFTQPLYERLFGVPRRTLTLIAPMLRYKLAEKARIAITSRRRR